MMLAERAEMYRNMSFTDLVDELESLRECIQLVANSARQTAEFNKDNIAVSSAYDNVAAHIERVLIP